MHRNQYEKLVEERTYYVTVIPQVWQSTKETICEQILVVIRLRYTK